MCSLGKAILRAKSETKKPMESCKAIKRLYLIALLVLVGEINITTRKATFNIWELKALNKVHSLTRLELDPFIACRETETFLSLC